MAKKPTLNPVVPPVQPTEVKAANQPYEANATTNFTVTPEGEKYGIVPINGTLGHVQAEQGQPYRNPEINKNIATLYQQEFAPNEQVDYNNPAKVQNFVSTQWAKNKDKMPELYARKNLISTQPIAESPKVEPTPEEKAQGLIDKAAKTGKSWLQLYHEQMPKPEYNSKRANALQTNANLSVLADIIKLVGEGVTTDKGGTPIARQSIAPHLNAQLAQLNDLYKREVQAYNQNGFQYLMADERDKRARAAQKIKDERDERAKAQAQLNADRSYNLSKTNSEENRKITREGMDRADERQNKSISATRQNHRESLAASRDKKDNEKSYSIIVNGQSVKVPISYINDVSGKVKSTADANSPSLAMQPAEVFSSNWNKYYNYQNGSFIPKAAPAAHVLRPGEYRENGQVMKKVPTTQKKIVSAKPYNPVTNAFVPQTQIKSR